MTKSNRQLAAIVFTDIVGYSAIMREDEAKGRALRQRHREVFNALTPQYGGSILQYYGDGTLSIFQSAVAAVECAVEMQRAFQVDPMVPLRIGIHSGDITFDQEEVFGDGVNVASRIENSCISGGIFISDKVFDDIRNHAWLEADNLGLFRFKNIKDPIQLFAISNEGIRIPSSSSLKAIRAAYKASVLSSPKGASSFKAILQKPLGLVISVLALLLIFGSSFWIFQSFYQNKFSAVSHTINSIAVLPFSNFSSIEENDYFSDGITEDILTLISKIDDFKVVSRTSVMQYKETEKSIPQISKELNAQYILEGSVRRDGNKVRISAQLIDGAKDEHIWAETYNREFTEIFEVQSLVAQDIANALELQLSDQEKDKLWHPPTEYVKAYEYYLQGRTFYRRYTPRDNKQAIQLFQQALYIDSSFAQAYAGLGDAIAQKAVRYGKEKTLLDSALFISQHGVNLDDSCSECFKSLGLAYQYMGDSQNALDAYLKAVELDPTNDMALNNIATIFKAQGNMEEAIRWSKRAMETNPQSAWTISTLAGMYASINADEQCRKLISKGINKNPDFLPFYELQGRLSLIEEDFNQLEYQAARLMQMPKGKALGHELLAHGLVIQKDYPKAKEHYEQALALYPVGEKQERHKWNQLDYAFLQMQLGEMDSAKQELALMQKLYESKTQDAEEGGALFFLGTIHLLQGEDEKALQLFEQAIRYHWTDYRLMLIHPAFERIKNNNHFKSMIKSLERQIDNTRRTVALLEEDVL